MKASRNITRIINFCLDNLCPPILRDCYPIMYPIYRAAYGKQTAKLLQYKDVYSSLTEEEYSVYYKLASQTSLSQRPTDLNRAGIRFIIDRLAKGEVVLDAGCGRGYLAKLLASRGLAVTALDIDSPANEYYAGGGYSFVQGSIDRMPFSDASFDTVICSHVLEHVPNFQTAVTELIRVARRQVIIVLPRQREYRYVADLHIRYFPYEYNIKMLLPQFARGAEIQLVGGDWAVVIAVHNL